MRRHVAIHERVSGISYAGIGLAWVGREVARVYARPLDQAILHP